MTTIERPTTTFLWLHLTDLCQLECRHCATDSSPAGTHGSMTVEDWKRVIDEAVEIGVWQVQMVGGEPTLHPALPELINYALAHALAVEVFSNLVHVADELWSVLEQPGVSLATSYYSDDPDEHAAITGRPSHARTKANIAEAQRRGIPLRAGVIDLGHDQRVEQARTELVDLGVPAIGYDQMRELGRGNCSREPSAAQLCGQCGDSVAAIGPDGEVRPCLFARWITIGNVHNRPFREIGHGMPIARAALLEQGMVTPAAACGPSCSPTDDGSQCYPHNAIRGET